MSKVKFLTQESVPLEMHKVSVVQKTVLQPIERRVKAIRETGFNSYLLTNDDIYLDLLTDSGVNAMSDEQLGAMMRADDSCAGSRTFKRLKDKIGEIFGKEYFLPAHQGRACEHVIAKGLVREGDIVPMNFFFGTSRTQITLCGGRAEVTLNDEGINLQSDCPFKGNFDLNKLTRALEAGEGHIPFVRIEAGTNLIGGQPISLSNILDASRLCRERGVMTILDASLLQDNLYFIKTREEQYRDKSPREIIAVLSDAVDVIYFSARKLGLARGGAICTNRKDVYDKLKHYVSTFEGFLTYGGMSVREMEAIAVGLDYTLDMDVISQGPRFIKFLCDELEKQGVPVVTPAGGLGCHLDARKFVPQLGVREYPAGSLASAVYIASGCRGMERGGIDEPWEDPDDLPFGAMELVRLAVPRRVYTLSQMKYLVDRITWLYRNRDAIGGIRFETEKEGPHAFYDRLTPLTDWPEELIKRFRRDYGNSL